VRYADDFVILARRQTKQLVEWIEGMLEGRFRLTINREKTRIVKLRDPGASLTFLGFTLRYDRDRFGRARRYLNVSPSDKAQKRAREKLRELTGRHRCFAPITEVIAEVNQWLRGWGGYFRHGYPSAAFRKLNWYVEQRLNRHLNRRSQRAFRLPEGEAVHAHLRRMGLQTLWTTHR
jgi:RNA-directed DNA polymerase